MPEEAGDIHLTIVVLKATGLTSKSTLHVRSKPNGYVTIKWALGSKSQEHRTRVIKRTPFPEWNQSFQLLSQTMDSTILFEMFDNSPRHSYGIVEKTVRDLLAGTELKITFPSNGPVLSVTVEKTSDTSSAALNTLIAAQEAGYKPSQGPGQPKITVSCYAPLGEVVASLDKFVKIANTLAEIHPYIKAAWSVVSVAYNVVKDQLERDDAIRDLLETVAKLYGHASLMKDEETELNDAVVDILKQILKQTIECSLFIQEYSGKGFAAEAIKNSIVDHASAQIEEFNAVFHDLSTQLDRGLSVQTALVSIRIGRGVAGLATKVDKVASGVDMLILKDSLSPAQMNWANRPVCHPLTRIDIRSTISKWIVDPNETSVLWISGYVGSGKSTLATTIANFYADARRLGAFVFFQDKQINPDNFVSTLAYELCKFDQGIAKRISDAIADGKHSTQGLLDDQFKYLILQPLTDAISQGPSQEGVPLAHQGPIIIVIDALDECGDKFTRKRLLNVLAKETAKFPPFVRIIITSRPESDIRTVFEGKKHIKLCKLNVLPDDADINVYFESQLKEIAEDPDNSLDIGWPGDAKLRSLVSLAGGLFIWASTACKYISTFNPNAKLDDLLHTGVNKGKELDDLYLKALDSAGDWSDDELQKIFQVVVGAILVVKRPMTTDIIDKFLKLVPLQGLLKSPLKPLLSRLGSVIHHSNNEPVHIFHKSFSDFITNPERCTNPMWFINISHHEHCAALNCITRMQEEFATPRHFAPAITPKVDYDEVFKYSCSYWIQHVIAVKGGPDHVKTASKVHHFMKHHILHWFEASSILGISHSMPRMLERLYQWASAEGDGMDDLKHLAYDTYRFAVAFAETIAKHPAMVAQVALPFAPLMSKLYQLFHDHHKLPTVMGGYQQKWPSLLRTCTLSTSNSHILSVAFSPDMSNIVAAYKCPSETSSRSDYMVQCWETFSGAEVFPSVKLEFAFVTKFSPDGTQIWIASRHGSVYVLDTVTGDQLSELPQYIWMKDYSQLNSSYRWKTPSRPTGSAGLSSTHSSFGLHPEGESSMLQSSSQAASPEWEIAGSNICSASLSSNGRWAIFGNTSGQLCVINRHARKLAYDFWSTGTPYTIVFSPDNKMFVTGWSDGHINILQTDTGKTLHTLDSHTVMQLPTLAFSPGGDKLYLISLYGSVEIWNFTTTRHHDSRSSITTGDENILGEVFSAWVPGNYFLTMTKDLGHGNIQGGAPKALSEDRRTLAVGVEDAIQIWDVAGYVRNDINSFFSQHHFRSNVAFSPSGLIVRSAGSDTRFWSSVTGRLLPYSHSHSISANFIAQIDAGVSEDEEIRRKIQVNKERFHDAPDTLMTPSGDIISLENPARLLEVERRWEARIKMSTPENLTWRRSDSRIIYHHPESISNEDGTVKYKGDGQEIWRPPLEFGSFSCDIRPNFIALALGLNKELPRNGRVVIVHIPESLIVCNTQPA